jgi:hypothetical protein
MSGLISIVNLFLIPIFIALPGLILYFIIKISVKKAIKELKDENIL